MISPSQRPQPDNTQHSQQTKSMPRVGFEPTHDLSRRAAVDLRLRPRGYWDLHTDISSTRNFNCIIYGPVSVIGVATFDGLHGSGIESRWVARFSAPVQTGPEAHPASCKMGTVSFPGVKCGRGVTLTPHPLLVPRSKIE